VRSIAANQIIDNNNATKTPEPIPTLAIVIGTIKGNKIAPTIGVNATTERNIIKEKYFQ
tara:strand:- start:342 stop:518 length:177 start_codon:yes stop_codon:yes gene_type:complete